MACPEGLEPPTYGLEVCFRLFFLTDPELYIPLFS